MGFDFGLSPTGLIGVSVVGGILGVLLSGLLLRSACDLSGVDPAPSYLRCLVVALILGMINGALGYGIGLAAHAVTSALHFSDTAGAVLGVLADIPVSAAVSTMTFIIAFRLHITKALLVWLVYTLISLLVGAVIFMLLLGGATTVGAVRRLF